MSVYNPKKDMEKLGKYLFTLLFIYIFICLLVKIGHTTDRCLDYSQEIRVQHEKYFGLNYPYWYGIGQAKQESNCRTNVIAFDKGMGLTQFMPRTWKEVESKLGKLDPYNPFNSIKAQAWYMSQLHKQNWDGVLWLTYQAYNGGWGNLKKENMRANDITSWLLMKRECQRRKIVINKSKGITLDLCEVNYDYSKKIYKFGMFYSRMPDKWKFWSSFDNKGI